jgi:defect-in-organelle-trafficking protein DotC
MPKTFVIPFATARLACAVACAFAAAAHAEPAPASFDQLLQINTSSAQRYGSVAVVLTPVRETALREAAQTLGVQYGIRDRSREITQQLHDMSSQLDARYQFGALSLGVGFLPPVISEVRDPRAVENNVLHVAQRAFTIDEPPRAFIVAPTWRDWLLTGIDPDLQPQMPAAKGMYPRDDAEIAFYKATLQASYTAGRETAQDAFDLNLARLNRTYDGMRRYFDLFKRGMVSAPVIAAATTVADIKDPNTMIVGDTVIRVTVPVNFVGKTDKWVPLGN